MTKVVLINGPARSGKDTLGGMIYTSQWRPGEDGLPEIKRKVMQYKFAAVMQGLWQDIFYVITSEREYPEWVDGSKKNDPHPFMDVSFRSAMIDFSENYIKPTYGSDFFGRLTAEHIAKNEALLETEHLAVITDSGFKEEAVAIIEKFGAENVLLIKLYRDGYSFTGDSRNYLNLDEFGVQTVELRNKTLEQFRRDGVNVVAKFMSE